MYWTLRSQDSGKMWCLYIILTLGVFLPTWIITLCIYQPEELGPIRSICCLQPEYEQKERLNNNNSYVENIRIKRGIDFSENRNTLLKFKYNYARKTGYEKCWICSKLHPETMRIPLIAVPLNITSFLKGNPIVNLRHVSRKQPLINTSIPFPVVARMYLPDWCFRLGNMSEKNQGICKNSRFSIKLSTDMRQIWHIMDDELKTSINTIMDEMHPLYNSTGVVLAQLVLAGHSAKVKETLSQRPFTLGNNTFICCGKICYPWFPKDEEGWCFLATVIPVMGAIDGADKESILEISEHPKYPLKYRNKRELFARGNMAWSWFPAWTGWGIDLMHKLNNYSSIMDEIISKDSEDISKLNEEVRAIRKQLMLQEMAIESMGAALTGLCEVTENYECCTWFQNTSMEVPDYYEIIRNHRQEVANLQEKARSIAKDGWNPFKGLDFSLGSITSWLKQAAIMILLIMILLLIIYICYRLIMCAILKASQSSPHPEGTLYLNMLELSIDKAL